MPTTLTNSRDEDAGEVHRRQTHPMLPGERLCGFRLVGGIYVVAFPPRDDRPTFMDRDIVPYVFDSPIPIDPVALGVSPIGVTTVVRDGVTHILDWVGAEHYPTPESFLNEVRRMGLSRRVPRSFDFSVLEETSRIILIHPNCTRPIILGDQNTFDRGPAIIASFPIEMLAVIRDPTDANVHDSTVERMRGVVWDRQQATTDRGIPVRLEDR